jgi:hypothetical protein
VREGCDETQFDGFVREQAQSPASVPRGSLAASEGSNLGTLCARNLQWSARAGFIKESGVEPLFAVASFDIEDGGRTEAKSCRNGIRVLAAMQQVEDASACVSARSG